MRTYRLLALLFIGSALAAQPLRVLSGNDVTVGAARFGDYLGKLGKKNVAVVTNASGVVGTVSIVDTLLHLHVKVKKIFGPEHGFRGTADAGEKVKNGTDKKTGLPVISLYGSHKRPTPEDMNGIDIVVYDIQDVGVRFYTFISTLAYVMEACAENNKPLIVLDRPDPNGFYVDGPVLEDKYRSFLGMNNVPLVYGMTAGEYAQMLNGEMWLANKKKCDLTVIPVKGYEHGDTYDPPVKPSPNLPNLTAILLYPSLGLFEGTIMSLGRGTDMPFQVVGHPKYPNRSFSFLPRPNAVVKDPKYKFEPCYGIDLRREPVVAEPKRQLQVKWVMECYRAMKDTAFFDSNFNYHSGNDALQQMIKEGKSGEEIRKSWEQGVADFKKIRKKYLLYKDFE